MEGRIYTREKDCCLRRVAHTRCVEDGTAEQVKLVECFSFKRPCCRCASKVRPIVQTIKYLVRGVPSSAEGIVVKLETGETKGSP